jgi:AraC-like DNA-binding protein
MPILVSMLNTIALLFIGYSVFSALLLLITHFRCDNYAGQLLARSMGSLLLLILMALQLCHFAYLQHSADWLHTPIYQVLVFAVAPTFYLFSKPILTADTEANWSSLIHVLPLLVAPLLPFTVALPLAFVIGLAYLVWLGRKVYALRAQRQAFRQELYILGSVFIVGCIALIAGLILPSFNESLFIRLYASTIGLAFFLVNFALSLMPRLSNEVTEAARTTYAISTLTNVDCEAALVQLGNLLDQKALFKDPELDLAGLAKQLKLSSHQLSELINTRLGKSFSRYIREYRVEAAEDLLVERPSMPVLTVGLEVGFTSQSNFYEAFKEITGMSPGQYRKINLSQRAPKTLSA